MKTILRSIGVAALCAASVSAVAADDYPSKPITMVIPFAAGGPTDVVGRIIAQSMTTTLKKTVVVENTPGAGGTIAAARVARAAPDGYMLFLHHIGHSTAPSLYRTLPYNSIDSFEPVGLVADVPMTLIARKDFPAQDLKELIAVIKKDPKKVSLANAGLGAASHLCGMLFMSAIGTDLNTIPYKGTAPAMNDLMGGQVDLMCDQTTNTTSQIKGGKVKVYGLTTSKRLASLPGVPTLSEAGLPKFEVAVWHGLYAPKGTPKSVVDKLSQALQVALKDPMVVERFAGLGTEPVAQNRATPEALRGHLKAEIDKWAPIIKKAGIYAD
ncbi:tripartite tricarboxylate transporter substrate binding protein BugD [Lacisediminimonas profundi]|uniref:tripartite tricarboxylate transporter substrate binding protein BugD n=1 Tax=Lacisediminimonas profundi TaxID=2603856 RepID=UPI00124BA0BC|nr:tripartite tricarboxylate transporter substrate binding protein BugD [Lacisediminimonas profundi]